MVQAVITTVVVGLQGRPIASTLATNGQALAWNGASWAPAGPYLPIAGGVTTGAVVIPTGSSANRNFNIQADISGNSGAAGVVGEGQQNSGGPFNLGHATWGAAANITLQPGDWDVWGLVNHNPNIADCVQFLSAISTAPNGYGPITAAITGTAMGNTSLFAPVTPFRLGAAQVIWLNTYHFSASGSATAQITGSILARRTR